MSKLRKVTGEACLDYVKKPIGFINKEAFGIGADEYLTHGEWYNVKLHEGTGDMRGGLVYRWNDYISISKFDHVQSKRIVGFVHNKCDDGGLDVIVLGNETLTPTGDMDHYFHRTTVTAGYGWHSENPLDIEGLGPQLINTPIKYYPDLSMYDPVDSSNCGLVYTNTAMTPTDLSNMIDNICDIEEYTNIWESYNRPCIDRSNMSNNMLTNNPNTTLRFGGYYLAPNSTFMDGDQLNDPLVYLQGDLYNLCVEKNQFYLAMFPHRFANRSAKQSFVELGVQTGSQLMSFNLVSIPYNLILTDNLNYAQAYLQSGVLPPDAYLFPLDWESLPRYTPDDDPNDDTDDGEDPDNDPSGVDGDPDPPSVPHSPPQALSPNNYYWLSQSQLEDFFNWFWYDVGRLQDFDDLIKKIEGLYNDLGSTVINIRYMPVQIAWIGGAGDSSPIICGMIEKEGKVPTIAKTPPPIRDIGHVKVPKKFSSFASYSPYSESVLYLPYYGFINIDMDLFTGHEIYIKAIYDHLTGTIQYLIYYENEYLVNSVVAKMAVDIPITLQSKNDRDSAIFSNVSNAVSGLIGAGVSMGTGNPLGLIVGANALNSGVHSAPMTVRGVVGESGAFYAPSYCKLFTQFPIEAKPSQFNKFVGKLVNKTMYLNSEELGGYTECYNPRITFSNTIPLLEEEEEIYDYLTKGVIL